MGKSKEEKKEKKDKELKASTDKVKKEKKEKKDKKDKDSKKIKKDVVERLYDELTGAKKSEEKKEKKEDKDIEIKDVGSDSEGEKTEVVVTKAELLPFAHPILEGKLEKKVLKLIKKGAKARLLRRGVKEVVKHVRKLPTTSKPTSVSKHPQGFVVLAADISPMDVISHIPVLCEDHEVPYIFIRSRADLGKAAGTKRLTSAVACVPPAQNKGSEDEKEFMEIFEKCFEEVREADRRVPV